MSAFAELLGAIAAFLVEMAIYAAMFVFLGVRAIYSPVHRRKLKERWAARDRKRSGSVLWVVTSACCLVLVVAVLARFVGRDSDSRKIRLSDEEISRLKEIKGTDDVVGTAARMIKRMLEEQENKAEQKGERRN